MVLLADTVAENHSSFGTVNEEEGIMNEIRGSTSLDL